MSQQQITDEQSKELIKQFGYIKVNLVHKAEGNEGIWAVPCSEEDKKLLDDKNSKHEKFNCFLLSQPLGWCGKQWGSKVVARTNGDECLYVYAKDNV